MERFEPPATRADQGVFDRFADFPDVRSSPNFVIMRKEIQTLGVAKRLFPQILSGEKTSTIRWREHRVVPGRLKFVCDGHPERIVLVEVRRCTDMPLSRAAAFVGRADEWPDDVMLKGMREHYPDIQLSSIVQVIEFNLSSAD